MKRRALIISTFVNGKECRRKKLKTNARSIIRRQTIRRTNKILCHINTRSMTYISVIFCAAKINIIEQLRDNVMEYVLR